MPRRRALVTGAAGFLGSHLVRRLVDEGWEVTALARPRSQLRRLPREISLLEADLTTLEPDTSIPTVDVLFHLAAVGLHEPRPRPVEEVIRTNVLGTVNVVRLASQHGIPHLVHVGSGHEYGEGTRLREDAPLRPRSAYGASKAAAWLVGSALARLMDVEFVGLRPFTLYGPADSPHGLVGSAVVASLENEPLELTEGRQTRDFVFVADAVDALLAAADSRGDFEVANVCTGVETSIRDVVELVVELSGSTAQPLFGNRPYCDDEVWSASGDPTRAREALGWEAKTGLREGIAATVEWFRAARGSLEPETVP